MLSLSNAFEKKIWWILLKKLIIFLILTLKLEIFSEPKIDGISATLIYENGILTHGLSRGDGIYGENILENIKTISSIPKVIKGKDIPKLLEIRWDLYWKKDFVNMKDKFANPRNAAGGSLRQKDSKDSKNSS